MGNVCSCQSGQSQGIDPQTLAPRIKRPAQSSQSRQRGHPAKGTTRTNKKEEMQIRRSLSNPGDIEVIFGGPLPPRHDQAIRSYATNKSHPYSRPYPTPLQHPKRVRPLTGPPRPPNDLLDSAASSSSTVNHPPRRRPRIALSLRYISSHGASREREREAARQRECWRPTEKDSTAAARRRKREERAQERALRIHSGIPPSSSHKQHHQHLDQHHQQRGYKEPETPNTRQHRKFLEAGIPFAPPPPPPPPPQHPTTRPTTANRPSTSGADRDRKSEPKRGRSKRDTEREWLMQRQDEERQQLKWAKAASKADEEERLRRVRREQLHQQQQQPLYFPAYNPTATTATTPTNTNATMMVDKKVKESEKEREKREEEAEWAALLIEQKKKALVMEEERKASVKVRHEGEQRLSRLGLSGKVGLLVGTGIEGLGDREGGMAAEGTNGGMGAGRDKEKDRETKRYSTTLPVYTATSARITGPLMNEPAIMAEEEQQQQQPRVHRHYSSERSSREREIQKGRPEEEGQQQQQQQQQQQLQSQQDPLAFPLTLTHSLSQTQTQKQGKSIAQRERERAVGDILRWKWVHGKGKSVSSVDEELGLWT